ncbi:hypothetical protein SAMN06295933_3000 [Desulfovibrio gilichinskyi]|uniref:Uncharacterized protein n=1 Tax=Desulfovibrio gilichinskyi TaxID=1519643 RepID=A0A1X7EIG8_9BACT|nr:hypothetical protein SAMN06295933_3000 [Desulfovibrio gilichinskyi]
MENWTGLIFYVIGMTVVGKIETIKHSFWR